MPDWLDMLLVLTAIASALAFFVVRGIRRRRLNECGGGCCFAGLQEKQPGECHLQEPAPLTKPVGRHAHNPATNH